jgi:hypothetical protein
MIGSDEHLQSLGLLTVDFSAADEALADYISSLSAIAVEEDPSDLKERLQRHCSWLGRVGFQEPAASLPKQEEAPSECDFGRYQAAMQTT